MQSVARVVAIVVCCLLLTQTPQVANGQGYYGGSNWGWGVPYPFDYGGYRAGRIPTPPYFAIHPPVYFGRRVGMPYGNSLVTRPPRAVTETRFVSLQSAPQPQLIHNPFVAERPDEASAKVKQLAQRSKELTRREAALTQRMKALVVEGAELADVKNQLEKKGDSIRKNGRQLAQRASEIDAQQAELAEREAQLNKRAARLEREQAKPSRKKKQRSR